MQEQQSQQQKKEHHFTWCEPLALHVGWMHDITASRISSWPCPVDANVVAAHALDLEHTTNLEELYQLLVLHLQQDERYCKKQQQQNQHQSFSEEETIQVSISTSTPRNQQQNQNQQQEEEEEDGEEGVQRHQENQNNQENLDQTMTTPEQRSRNQVEFLRAVSASDSNSTGRPANSAATSFPNSVAVENQSSLASNNSNPHQHDSQIIQTAKSVQKWAREVGVNMPDITSDIHTAAENQQQNNQQQNNQQNNTNNPLTPPPSVFRACQTAAMQSLQRVQEDAELQLCVDHFESRLKDQDLSDDRHLRRIMELLLPPGLFVSDHEVPRFNPFQPQNQNQHHDAAAPDATVMIGSHQQSHQPAGAGAAAASAAPRSPLRWNWTVLQLSAHKYFAAFIASTSADDFYSLGFCLHLDCDSLSTAVRQARWMLACGAVRLLVAPPEAENPSSRMHGEFVEEVQTETWRGMLRQRWQHFLSAVQRYTLPKPQRFTQAILDFVLKKTHNFRLQFEMNQQMMLSMQQQQQREQQRDQNQQQQRATNHLGDTSTSSGTPGSSLPPDSSISQRMILDNNTVSSPSLLSRSASMSLGAFGGGGGAIRSGNSANNSNSSALIEAISHLIDSLRHQLQLHEEAEARRRERMNCCQRGGDDDDCDRHENDSSDQQHNQQQNQQQRGKTSSSHSSVSSSQSESPPPPLLFITPTVFHPCLKPSQHLVAFPPVRFLLAFKPNIEEALMKGYMVQLDREAAGADPLLWQAWSNFLYHTLFSLLPGLEQEAPLTASHNIRTPEMLPEGLLPGTFLSAVPNSKKTTWDVALRVKRFATDKMREESVLSRPVIATGPSRGRAGESAVIEELFNALTPFARLQDQQVRLRMAMLFPPSGAGGSVVDAASSDAPFASPSGTNFIRATTSLLSSLASSALQTTTPTSTNFASTTTAASSASFGFGNNNRNNSNTESSRQASAAAASLEPRALLARNASFASTAISMTTMRPILSSSSSQQGVMNSPLTAGSRNNQHNNNNNTNHGDFPSVIGGGAGGAFSDFAEFSTSASTVGGVSGASSGNRARTNSQGAASTQSNASGQTNNNNNQSPSSMGGSASASGAASVSSSPPPTTAASTERQRQQHQRLLEWAQPDLAVCEVVQAWRFHVLRCVSDTEFRISRFFFCCSRLQQIHQQQANNSNNAARNNNNRGDNNNNNGPGEQQQQQPPPLFPGPAGLGGAVHEVISSGSGVFVKCTCDRCQEDVELIHRCDPFVMRLLNPIAKQLARLLKRLVQPTTSRNMGI